MENTRHFPEEASHVDMSAFHPGKASSINTKYKKSKCQVYQAVLYEIK